MLAEFLDWWGAQLRTLVPAGPAGGADALIVDASQPDTLDVLRRRRGVAQRVVQVRQDAAGAPGLRAALNGRPRGEPVRLRIAPAIVLERAVTLPLAAERDLTRVLGYEMERLTPFAASEVIWDYAVVQRDRARGRLALRLTMVPRAAVDATIALLRDQGGAPDALEAALPDGTRVLKLVQEQSSGRRLAITARSLAAAAACLAVLVLASPFARQSLAFSDVQNQLAEMAPGITQVEALRHKISGAGAGGDAVAAETRRLGDTLEALAAVTEILPDDSYLTEFTMRERKITLSGLGASAPKLISGLSADPRIRNPAFTAPVTRSETNHDDVFSIRAELAP